MEPARRCRLDHVVVAAADLDAGAAWVEERLGVAPSGGGRHPRMATHNRVMSLGPVYLEVIAVDPAAPAPERARWFDLDNPWLAELLRQGPRVLTWAVNVPDLDGIRLPVETWGETVPMERGDFRWLISVPADGRLPFAGAAPTVLEWRSALPIDSMPDSGCRLRRVRARHPEGSRLRRLLDDRGLLPGGVEILDSDAGPGVEVEIETAAGTVLLG